ncbi:site-2 protease family protein [Thiotrichales bacterium 19S11-10]|nr:site-2 protease family protein [Thiotrichales bacterium 19S11-10]
MGNIYYLLLAAIPVLFAITLHEVGHALAAKLRGDNTAEMMGRLTANPIKHIDPIGTIIIPVLLFSLGGLLFGWAKPVPVNERHLKNPKYDRIIVAIAGPFANLIMAVFWALIAKIAFSLGNDMPKTSQIFTYMGYFGVQVNLILMTFNLVPIPPLDGSRVVSSFLPTSLAIQYERIERYGFFIILALLAIPINNKPILMHIIEPLLTFFSTSLSLIFKLPF